MGEKISETREFLVNNNPEKYVYPGKEFTSCQKCEKKFDYETIGLQEIGSGTIQPELVVFPVCPHCNRVQTEVEEFNKHETILKTISTM